jgi:hypothetical protein
MESGLGFGGGGVDRVAEGEAMRGQSSYPRRKTTDRWATPVGVWREEGQYRFGKAGTWAVGRIWG